MTLAFKPGSLIVVPVRLYGPESDVIVRLALDTGATQTMINWDLLVLTGYDPAAVKERVQMTTGSGIEFVPVITMEEIEALSQTVKDIPVICHTLPASATVDGVLGLDFFKGKKLAIDFKKGLVELG